MPVEVVVVGDEEGSGRQVYGPLAVGGGHAMTCVPMIGSTHEG